MSAIGIGLALVYMKCRKLSPRAVRIARIVSSLALFFACLSVCMAIAFPGPVSRYQYGEITRLARNVIGPLSAIPLLLIPLWLTVLFGTFDLPFLSKARWPAIYVAIAGAALSPVGLFASIFAGCKLAGACL